MANKFAIRDSGDFSDAFEEEYEGLDLPPIEGTSLLDLEVPATQDRPTQATVLSTNQDTSRLAYQTRDKLDNPEQQKPWQQYPYDSEPPESLEHSTGRNFGDDTGRSTLDPYGGMPQKDAGKGWGSFGSWINTAVSTVSEVIENPNVVVSKAHTLGQGIRNAATGHIDRVYESLDPEYDYQKERQLKHQHQQQYNQYQGMSSSMTDQLPSASQKQASSPLYSQQPTTSGPAHTPIDRKGSSFSQDESHGLHPSQPMTQPSNTLSKTGPPTGNLVIKGEIDDGGGEEWGNDAWGDGWDDTMPSVNIEPEIGELSTQGQDTATALEDNSAKLVDHSLESIAPQPPVEPKAISDPHPGGLSQPFNTRNVRDLFSMESKDSTTSLGAGTTRNFSKPHGHENGQFESPPQMKLSSDLRPAEALFSTLDFASNALGNAVLGMHRKVTQSSQPQPSKAKERSVLGHTRPESPFQGDIQTPPPKESLGARQAVDMMDKSSHTNPSLEAVGGNVVSTGLGALEILGKKAVDVISDVRRAGHLSHAQNAPDLSDDPGPFKIPPKMNLGSLFDEAGGRVHLTSMRSLTSTSTSHIATLTKSRPELLEMGQFDELGDFLDPIGLNSAITDLSVDILAGYKDFRSILALLERMGVQGTSHLRQLRNGTRKLTTLVPDSVNAFEQEWHNHQLRASERDFFARVPIKKFFESRLLSIYSDGLRSISQFTHRTCDQTLRLAESFHIRLTERLGQPSAGSTFTGVGLQQPPPLILAQLLQQFLGNLLSELRFITKMYCLTLDAVLSAAKQFTTPLDRLDWEDLAMGTDNIKDKLMASDTQEATGFIHSGAVCIMDILKNQLIVDALHGNLVPKARVVRPKKLATPVSQNIASSSAPFTKPTSGSVLRPPTLEPESEHKSATLSPPGSRSTQAKTLLQPTASAPGPTLSTTGGSNDPANPMPTTSPQNSSRQTRVPPARPVLKDEDFFSILNDPTG
ncbi:hypothetical protein B0O80DRAFT_432215 [Mortierella sp. GBAus27b]|nr:hypothetical protein B0O80DRAFT_432215 [Mortierella sp. GBAus27b]